MHRLPRFLVTACVTAAAAGWAAPARAQTWSDRVWISLNPAFQVTVSDFDDRFEFERYAETGSTDVGYPIERGLALDGGGGYRIWRSLGAGVAVSSFTRDGSAEIESRIPHPFFDDRHRQVTGTAGGISRTVTAIHAHAMYMAAPTRTLRLVLSAGPSYFNVEHDLVRDVRIAEAYPFDEATFSSAETGQARGSAIGFNAGVDVAWMFARHLGAGGMLRFARASVDLEGNDDRVMSIDAGGLQAGAGLRIVF